MAVIYSQYTSLYVLTNAVSSDCRILFSLPLNEAVFDS